MNKKRFMNYCSVLLIFAFVINFLIVNTTMIQATTVQSINKKKVTLTVGKTTTLKVNGLRGTITWISDHPKIASINKKGIVTALKKGTATITAKVKYKTSSNESKYIVKILICKVTVINKQNNSTTEENNSTVITNSPEINNSPVVSISPSVSNPPEVNNHPVVNNAPVDNNAGETSTKEIRIRMTFAGGEAVAVLYDNPTTQSLLSQLPVVVNFSDFGRSEKICYFPQSLSKEGAPNGYNPQVGDVACYGPWGNIAIYYHDSPYASGLIPMGYIESGLDTLARKSNEFEVAIESME